MVVWLMGLSGSGKTTLGKMLGKYLSERNISNYFIDGDQVRDFYDNDLGYTEEERRHNVKRITYAANVLSENKIVTIVCNIAPFEDLRVFARKKIKDYVQIYLSKDFDDCKKDDVNKVYENNFGKTHLVGKDVKFDDPISADLNVHTSEMSEEEAFNEILLYLKNNYSEVFCAE